MPDWAAILFSSVGFMLHHVVIVGMFLPGEFWRTAVPLALAVAVGGAFWAWLYRRSGSLVAPWLSHCLVDVAILAVGFHLLRGYWE